MIVVPTSRIILLKNPIEIDYSNELTFASKQAQFNYFYNLPKIECDEATYQRKDDVVRFPTDPKMEGITYDDLIQYNYCMYQNDKWSDKWFYAFVKSVTFDNPGMSYVELETDVWQSWCFDITFKNSFIEREHVNNDTIGAHTIPENLETGEYISKLVSTTSFGTAHPVMMVTEYCKLTLGGTDPYDMEDTNKLKYGGGTLGGIYQGCEFLLCGDDKAVMDLIAAYDQASKKDAIVGLFMAPDSLTGYPSGSGSGTWYYTQHSGGLAYGPFLYLNEYAGYTSNMGKFSVSKPYNNIDGVTPKNNKLYTYPFIYMIGTNNTGIETIYHYEYFADDPDPYEPTGFCNFQTYGVICPGCSIKTVPLYYKNIDFNYSEGIPLGKYPICSYSTDMYTNWLTLNSVNTAISLVGSGIQIAAGGILASTGAGALAGAGQIASGLTGIASTLGSIHQHSLMPRQAQGDVNTGDVTYSMGRNNFSFYQMNIKAEMVHVIDNFFSMFGYKVSTVKLPNITGRTNWNYVKTIDCNIVGDIPQVDLQKIKDIFNKGVTMWHNPTTFLDYSQSNGIV